MKATLPSPMVFRLRGLCLVIAVLGACRGRSYSAAKTETTALETTAFAGDTLPELTAQGNPQPGGSLAVAVDTEPGTLNYQLDPADTWARKIGGLILDTLAQPNPQTWQPEPHLAERWEVDGNGQSVTFHLRRGVRWDDGVPFTADDVLFTFEVLRQPTSHSDAARFILAPLAPDSGVEKIDDYTVRFHFSRPYAFGFDAISETAIYPRHIYAGGDFNNHPANRAPVGTGPYRLLRWAAGDRLILEKNPRYWGKAPWLQHIVFRVLTLPERRLTLLKRGEVDVIERLTPAMWQSAAADPNMSQHFWRLRHVPSSLQWIGYNQTRPYFASATVRRALTELIDRQAIVRDMRLGLDQVAASWFYPGAREYSANLKPWPYDPVQASQLLDESGWVDHDGDGIRDHQTVPFRFTLLYPAGNGMYPQLASVVQKNLAQAGIGVVPQAIPWADYRLRLQQGDFDACMSLWTMVPHSDPYPVWHSSATGTRGFNFVGFADPDADQLLEQGRQTFDEAKRVGLYQHLNALLHRDEPYTMLFYRYHLSLVSRRFGGVYSTPYGLLRYEDFYVRSDAPSGPVAAP